MNIHIVLETGQLYAIKYHFSFSRIIIYINYQNLHSKVFYILILVQI